MVNLIEYYVKMTESPAAIRSKIDIVFKYIKEKDKSFISKTLLALKQLIFKENVNSIKFCRLLFFIGFFIIDIYCAFLLCFLNHLLFGLDNWRSRMG